MELAKDLKPALAAISGGLGDIGLAMAGVLARAGAGVAVGDLHGQAEGAAILQAAGGLEGQGYFQPLDVTDGAGTGVWFDAVETHFGRVPNILVANAAVVTLKPLLSMTAEEWSREIQVNLTGAYLFAKVGAERLRREGRSGRIVLVGSWAGHAPHPDLPAYSVAKAGLRMLTKCLALELAPAGILVNELAPGYVDAGLSGRIYEKDSAMKARALEGVPIGKLLSVEGIAAQLLYLCSDLASHMTGSTLLVDGGLSLLQGPQRVHE